MFGLSVHQIVIYFIGFNPNEECLKANIGWTYRSRPNLRQTPTLSKPNFINGNVKSHETVETFLSNIQIHLRPTLRRKTQRDLTVRLCSLQHII